MIVLESNLPLTNIRIYHYMPFFGRNFLFLRFTCINLHLFFFQGIHPLKNDFLEVENDESYDTVSATIDAANDEVLLKEVRQNLFDVHNKRVLKNFDKLTGYTILNQGGTAFS